MAHPLGSSVSAVQPILAAIETIAAHCKSCSARCSATMRKLLTVLNAIAKSGSHWDESLRSA